MTTAWHGSQHPASTVTCPTCAANPGAPCVASVGAFGFATPTVAALTGYHAARLREARTARP